MALTTKELDPIGVVLAAGRGTRMESDLPKVLFAAAGKPLVRWVVEALTTAGVHEQIVVIGYGGELVRAALVDLPGVTFAHQQEQRGTGDAVAAAAPLIQATLVGTAANGRRPVVIVCGDSPLLRTKSVTDLLEQFTARQASCLVGTALAVDPAGLGRIVRGPNGCFRGIVEEKDATTEEKMICEVNMSTYVFAADDLLWALSKLNNANTCGEYYLTDCPGLLLAKGCVVDAVACLDQSETLSVNTPTQLAAAAMALQKRFHTQTPPAAPVG